jgi:hypothetical protein
MAWRKRLQWAGTVALGNVPSGSESCTAQIAGQVRSKTGKRQEQKKEYKQALHSIRSVQQTSIPVKSFCWFCSVVV